MNLKLYLTLIDQQSSLFLMNLRKSNLLHFLVCPRQLPILIHPPLLDLLGDIKANQP